MTVDTSKFWEIYDRCGGCRYRYKSVFSEPCRTGMRLICYSGACAGYKPSLRTIVKDLIRNAKKEGDRREGGQNA